MAWAKLNATNASYLGSARLDFSLWLETTGAPPPVAFSTRSNLESWCQQIGNIKVESFGRTGGALRIHGFLNEGWYYDQIWAARNYSGYRNLMLKHALDGFCVDHADLNGIDADHVIARTVLKNLPSAWVAIFPVPAVSNRPFGKVEKLLAKVSRVSSCVTLSPTAAVKLFCGRFPISLSELNFAMRDVRGQIITKDKKVLQFVTAMERDVRPYLRQR